LNAFASVLPGSLHGLSDKPRWLLYTSRSSGGPRILPTPLLVNGSPVIPSNLPTATNSGPDAGNPEEDFATWFTWQSLRLGSTLEYTLLGFNAVDEGKKKDKWTSEQVERERKALRHQVELTMVGIIEASAKSAVRIQWRGAQRDDPTKDGGVGKAREIMDELIKLVQSKSSFAPRG